MWQSLTDPILHAYTLAKPHLLDDECLPDDLHIQLLVRFKLGDLRELDRQRGNGKDTNTTILSGG